MGAGRPRRRGGIAGRVSNRNRCALYGFVYFRVGGRADVAEDVVQGVFVQALQRAEDYDPSRGSLQTWLRLLARNVVRASHRSESRQNRLKDLWRHLRGCLGRDEFIADESLIQGDTRDLVNLTLSTLAGEQQVLLRAHYLDCLTPRQLAAQHGVTNSVMRSRLSRARVAFRRAFEALQEADDV